MAEKVLIQSCIKKVAKDNNPYQSIVTGDGRKCTSWRSDFSNHVNQEVVVDITKSGNFTYIEFPAQPQQPAQSTAEPMAQPTVTPTTIQISEKAVVESFVNALVDLIKIVKQ